MSNSKPLLCTPHKSFDPLGITCINYIVHARTCQIVVAGYLGPDIPYVFRFR